MPAAAITPIATAPPAPLGPGKPVTRPGRAAKVRPSTAVTGPLRWVSFSASIMSGTLGAGVWPTLLSR
jgi:hypothetical protein